MIGCEVHPKNRLAPCDLAALGPEAVPFASDTGRKTMNGGKISELSCGNDPFNCILRLAMYSHIKNPQDCLLKSEQE